MDELTTEEQRRLFLKFGISILVLIVLVILGIVMLV
jgi:hypothetical protein